MASKLSARLYTSLASRMRLCPVCAGSAVQLKPRNPVRQFSTSLFRSDETSQTDRPRWSYTPEQMKAPFNPRTKDPRKAWEANDDPGKLDAMYIKFLGRGGDKVLTDEIKWLAVTHKSFDQGRRGFNDRLAFFGKRILFLQGTFALLHSPTSTATQTAIPDPYGRTPFEHPALDGLQNLNSISISEVLTKQRLGQLATSYGISEVTRWKPRNPMNLEGSGRDVVHTASLYAILGALALQRGGEFANQIARDRVLKPLGI